jgi:hypothetical protein
LLFHCKLLVVILLVAIDGYWRYSIGSY